MKKNLVGNFLLIILVIFSVLFFYYSFSRSNNRLLDASFMTLVMMFFYFYGKGMLFNYKKHKNLGYMYMLTSRLVIIAMAMFLPLLANNSKFGIDSFSVFSFSLIVSIIIGFDAGSYIDSALESQVYAEMPEGVEFGVINLFVYLILAILLIIFYPRFM